MARRFFLQRRPLSRPLGWVGATAFELARFNLLHAIANISELTIDDKLIMLSPAVQTIKGYFGFSKQGYLVVLKKIFEQQITAMKVNGTIKRLNQRYALEYTNF